MLLRMGNSQLMAIRLVWCSDILAGDHTKRSSGLDTKEDNVERVDILRKSVKISTRRTVNFYM